LPREKRTGCPVRYFKFQDLKSRRRGCNSTMQTYQEAYRSTILRCTRGQNMVNSIRTRAEEPLFHFFRLYDPGIRSDQDEPVPNANIKSSAPMPGYRRPGRAFPNGPGRHCHVQAIFGSVVLYPSDAVSTESWLKKLRSIMMTHSHTRRLPHFYREDEQFTIGGSKVLRKSEQTGSPSLG
jgi:hypothetical protein